MDVSVNIRKAENGFILRYDDPEIVRENEKDDKWKDPSVEVVFADPKEALQRVQTVLTQLAGEEAMAEANFDSAFKEASSA